MKDRSSSKTWCAFPIATQSSDMVSKGRDLEKVVLSRAVRWHLENRVLVYTNKTVVFA